MVEGAEVEVGEELAGEVADRDSGRRWSGGIYFWAVVDDAIDQPEGVGAFDFAANQCFENAVVDIGKIAADVGLEDVGRLASEVGEAF